MGNKIMCRLPKSNYLPSIQNNYRKNTSIPRTSTADLAAPREKLKLCKKLRIMANAIEHDTCRKNQTLLRRKASTLTFTFLIGPSPQTSQKRAIFVVRR